MEKEIVVYSRSYGCPYVRVAKRVFDQHKLAYREILINHDAEAKQRVIEWTGFESVPTIIVARPGEDFPLEPPTVLPAGGSPKGVNRNTMITEPSERQLIEWLQQHSFID